MTMSMESRENAAEGKDVEADKKPAEKAAEKPAEQGTCCPTVMTALYGACLAACDGYINANTKIRFGTYGGMMTGNTVALGKSFAEEEWESVALFATIIFLFFCGAFVGWLVGRWKKQGSFRFLVLVVGVGFLAIELIVHAIEDEDEDKEHNRQRWASVISPFLMGIVDVIGFKGSLGQHITFMTGNLQKLAGTSLDAITLSTSQTDVVSKPNTAKGEKKKLSKVKRDLSIVGAIWISYVLGAVSGACMTKVPNDGAWTLCLPAAIITVLIFINEGPDRKPAEKKKEPPLFRLFNVEGKSGISFSDVRSLYTKLGLTLNAEEEARFYAADSNDDGILDPGEFRAWCAA